MRIANRLVELLLLGVVGCTNVGDDIGSIDQATITTVHDFQVTATESGDPAPNTRLQIQPAVSFFGDPSTPTWIICYNDDTHRGDAQPNASGISCNTVDGNGNRSAPQPIWTQWPFATGNPNTFSDCALARDPSNPNIVWIVSLTEWNSATAGNRLSIGEAQLVFDPTCASCVDELNHAHDHTCAACPSHFDLVEPSPGFFGAGDRMVPIAADGIEGPTDSGKGPVPDRPTIAIDPVADASGNHQHYIAFFQNDNSVNPSRGRILVARRNHPAERYWSSPVAPFAEGIAGTDGWVNDDGFGTQFEAPQLVIGNAHQVGVGYLRMELIAQGPPSDPAIVNNGSLGIPLNYFFGVSTDMVATPFQAREIRLHSTPVFDSEPGSVGTGSTGQPFTFIPTPSVAFDSVRKVYVMAMPTNNIGSLGGPTGGWDVSAYISTDLLGTAWTLLPTIPRAESADVSNRVFPILNFDAGTTTFLLTYLEAVDQAQTTWRPAFNTLAIGASAWTAASFFSSASKPTPVHSGQVTWGGFWGVGGGGGSPGTARAGDFGDNAGGAVANGQFFYAWPDSRLGPGSSPPVQTTDIFGAILR